MDFDHCYMLWRIEPFASFRSRSFSAKTAHICLQRICPGSFHGGRPFKVSSALVYLNSLLGERFHGGSSGSRPQKAR